MYFLQHFVIHLCYFCGKLLCFESKKSLTLNYKKRIIIIVLQQK